MIFNDGIWYNLLNVYEYVCVYVLFYYQFYGIIYLKCLRTTNFR